MAFNLESMKISGKEVLPLIEGGKGVGVSTGLTSGAWAKAGGIGTVSAVNASRHDADGKIIPVEYKGKSRKARFEELVEFGIEGGLTQLREAHEIAGGNGRLHVNVLWEMGGAQRVLHGILEQAQGIVNGVTCGAGMPFKLAEIAAQYGVHYYPIVSSGRAFRALWLRSYRKAPDLLGGVVYEDPWLAGGHNGLSNSERFDQPEDPYPRVKELRATMNKFGLEHTPIIMAGGVWYLRDWTDWMDNPEIGPIIFQFGTRPLLTQESPVRDSWGKTLLGLKEGDVALNPFSPTGFYSSAVRNNFLNEMYERSERQVVFTDHAEAADDHTEALVFGVRKRELFLTKQGKKSADKWIAQGFSKPLMTQDSTLIFVSEDKAAEIRKDQLDCMGCLSQCKFSNWADNEKGTTGQKADPRSFCIQKTLLRSAYGDAPEDNLMFSGHAAYKFALDPFYANGFIPTVKQLVDRIASGD
ncbi:MAG: nitronate monooxygenase [Mariprofundaceae bacterium]|nr:nitronate monooxygenase [Mariprofundaceae bacterium]